MEIWILESHFRYYFVYFLVDCSICFVNFLNGENIKNFDFGSNLFQILSYCFVV